MANLAALPVLSSPATSTVTFPVWVNFPVWVASWLVVCVSLWWQCVSSVYRLLTQWTLALTYTASKSTVPKPFLLPPATHPERLCIVLDLDETLIASWAPADAPPSIRSGDCPLTCTVMRLPYGPGVTDASSGGGHANQPMRHTAHAAEGRAQQAHAGQGAGFQYGKVLVVERPGLRSFLRQLSVFGELVLFTAAVPEYAEPVVREVLDPDGSLFQGRILYRQHTLMRRVPTSSSHHNSSTSHGSTHGSTHGSAHTSVQCVKDLSLLGRDLSRVVIVDNNPFSFLHQPSNGVPCLPFRADPSDRHLSTVLLPLMQSLALFPDVRPILDARFRLGAWFAQRGLVPPGELPTGPVTPAAAALP